MENKIEVRVLSKAFALRIIKLCKYMLDKYRGDIIVPILVKQVLRSGTSIAANISESKNAQSKNDFKRMLPPYLYNKENKRIK